MLRTALVLATFLCTPSVLHAQAAPAAQHGAPAIRPGTYDLAITFGGGVIPGSLKIGYVKDSLTAGVVVGEHESPVKPGEQKGSMLILEAASPAVKIRYQLAFRGDSVTGTFEYDGQSGTVAGRRAASK